VKSYIAGGAGWEPDVHQPGTPYASGNHFAQCGKLNVFRRGVDAARIYPLDQPPPPSMAFVALGDSGRGSADQWNIAHAMEAFCRQRGCDFALLLGDNIYDSGASSESDPQFQSKFEQPYAGLHFPFYPVLGNHDYGAGGAGRPLVGNNPTRFQSSAPGFLYVSIEGPTLTASFVDAGGQVGFTRTLSK